MNSKICSVCREHKLHEDFSNNKREKDGKSSRCKKCVNSLRDKDYHKKYYKENKEIADQYKRDWSEKNKEKVKLQKKQKYNLNVEAILENKRKYYLENREKILANKREYSKLNRSKKNANEAKRHSRKNQRTPSWLTTEHLKQIEAFFWLSRDLYRITGEVYNVDHIVPLQGKNVCGLHVPWNLQVLPRDLNIKKGNKYNDW